MTKTMITIVSILSFAIVVTLLIWAGTTFITHPEKLSTFSFSGISGPPSWLWLILVIPFGLAVVIFVAERLITVYQNRKTAVPTLVAGPSPNPAPARTAFIWLSDKDKPGLRLAIAYLLLNVAAMMVTPYGVFITKHPILFLGLQVLILTLVLTWAGTENTGKVGRRWLTRFALIVVVVGIIHHVNKPDRYFDSDTGEIKKFLVADKEGKMYENSAGKFSPFTGEPLRVGTPEDVQKFQKRPLADYLTEGWKSIVPEASASESKWPADKVIHLPADGSFTKPLPLPPVGATLRWQTDGDVFIKFLDGKTRRVNLNDEFNDQLSRDMQRLSFASVNKKEGIVVVQWLKK